MRTWNAGKESEEGEVTLGELVLTGGWVLLVLGLLYVALRSGR